MKSPQELSNLLITTGGLLVLLPQEKDSREFEILGIRLDNGDLTFKIRKL